MSYKIAKKIALVILLFPITFLLLFTIGEISSGDISGLSHISQLAPLLLVIYIAWRKPVLGGIILSVTSLILGAIWYMVASSFENATIIIVELVLFLPPFIAGLLFIHSGIRNGKFIHPKDNKKER